MDDIEFLALPKISQIREAVHRINFSNDPNRNEYRRERIVEKYSNASYRLNALQEDLAVIALEALRPMDFRELSYARKEAYSKANKKFREGAVKIFSEICTKGM